jgi:hypothetical protein
MPRQVQSYLALLLFLALSYATLTKTGITGDGGEYLLVTHALFKHQSMTIGAADVADYAHMAREAIEHFGLQPSLLDELLRQAQSAKPEVVSGGFFPAAPGQFYSIHFWLYSLLALPFYALLKPLGFDPVAAFTLLNIACAGAVFAYLRRVMPRHAPLAFLAFLAAGTTFYLRWTGPEVLTASCALVATLAMFRGRAGLAILLAGVGASQNPPMIFLMPFAVVLRYLVGRYPSLRWPDCAPPPLRRSDALPVAAGLAIALAPMAFFQLTFGVPSLIAKYMTSPDLVTPQRFLSLYFDLDQGMVVGAPAVFLALVLPPLLLAGENRRAWLATAGLTLAMIVAMSLPALAAGNWNSGCSVMIRYAYWLAMPMLALALRAAVLLPPARSSLLLLAIVLGQLPLLAINDVFGAETSHTAHTKAARWMLDHHPSRYNPDAEIFYERDVGHEAMMLPDLVYVRQVAGKPSKVLRHWSNFESSAGLCPAGRMLLAGSIANVNAGWQYLHAPFSCVAVGSARTVAWRFNGSGATAKPLLGSGWSVFEGTGIWSDGTASELKLPVPKGRQPVRIRMQGMYYTKRHRSEVSVNGQALGNYNLPNDAIELPEAMRNAPELAITLRHPNAESPKARGESPDERMLGFYLQTIVIETELPPAR